jgi:uncharacterized protein YndB with AHSA1/START domain/DNA-binding transcriptional ArsR family regulator
MTVKQMLKVQKVRLDDVFAVLAHPIRRAIIERLAEGECTVGELAEPHDVSLPAISQHLRALEEVGLLEQTHTGRVRRCALKAAPLSAAFSWIVQYRIFWEDMLDEIGEKVERRGKTMTETKAKTKTTTGTVRLSRIFKAPRERVFKAFLDPDAFAKWIPPNGYTAHVYKFEPKVGGAYRMSFSSLDKKDTHFFGGKFLEIKPYERLHYTDKFESDDPQMQGEMNVTVTFKDVPGGTEVRIVQEGVPKIIPVEGAMQGWTQSLENLARLVEQ